jgi:predicted RNase H-like nuclease
VVFLGIDFGWVSQPSGLAVVDEDGGALRLIGTERRTSVEDVLGWVDEHAGSGPAFVGVDAPLVIPNASGMREVDKLAHRHFGKYHAGCYPANLGRPFAPRTLALARGLEERGFRHADSVTPRVPGRYQIEVHPHAACVQLFRLDRILKYKKGLVADRVRVLKQYRRLLLTLLPKARLPRVPDGGPELKAAEDQLDAVLCAYIAMHYWTWGEERNLVLGSVAGGGYIVIPKRS